jgi:hypothetical protein
MAVIPTEAVTHTLTLILHFHTRMPRCPKTALRVSRPHACPPPYTYTVASIAPNWNLRIEAKLQGFTPLINP